MNEVEVVRTVLEGWRANAPRRDLIDREVEWIMPHLDLSASGRDAMGPAMDDFRRTWQEYDFEIEDLRQIVRFEAFIRREEAFRAAGLPEDTQSHS
jgi:hypothetical protein